MTRPEDFELQHSDVPQPKLLDGPVVTDGPWPMPVTHPMPEEPMVMGFDLSTTGEQP